MHVLAHFLVLPAFSSHIIYHYCGGIAGFNEPKQCCKPSFFKFFRKYLINVLLLLKFSLFVNNLRAILFGKRKLVAFSLIPYQIYRCFHTTKDLFLTPHF